jgi:hypothetical protein
VETLPDWMEIQTKDEPLWFTTPFYANEFNMQKRSWSELLIDYDFEISYLKGMVKRVVDTLSRRPHILSVIPLQMNLHEKILTIAQR